jgi:hypothetical protein
MKDELVFAHKNELPDGWRIKKISDIVIDQLSGFACAINKLVKKDGYVQLRPFNIEDNGNLNLETLYQVPINIVNTELYVLKKGDILFNNTNSTGVPSKVHTRQLVQIQPEERLATTSELNPTPSLVTG